MLITSLQRPEYSMRTQQSMCWLHHYNNQNIAWELDSQFVDYNEHDGQNWPWDSTASQCVDYNDQGWQNIPWELNSQCVDYNDHGGQNIPWELNRKMVANHDVIESSAINAVTSLEGVSS